MKSERGSGHMDSARAIGPRGQWKPEGEAEGNGDKSER